MQKRWFWGIGTHRPEHQMFLIRFRSRKQRDRWVAEVEWEPEYLRDPLKGDDPEVRRIKRRIAAGEQVIFPVEID